MKYQIVAYVDIPQDDALMAEQMVEDLFLIEGWQPTSVVANQLGASDDGQAMAR